MKFIIDNQLNNYFKRIKNNNNITMVFNINII